VPTWIESLAIGGMNPNEYDLATTWPSSLVLDRLSVLQCPSDSNMRNLVLQSLKADCKRQTIPSSSAMQWAGLYISHPSSKVPFDRLLSTTDLEITAKTFREWLTTKGMIPSIYIAAWFNACDLQVEKLSFAPKSESSAEWKLLACQRAIEIVERDRAKDLFPSQVNIADEIARKFRKDGTVGEGGKPLTGAYIKRHALKGISSKKSRQLSTKIRRSK
jgi:hypothetical protein